MYCIYIYIIQLLASLLLDGSVATRGLCLVN